MNQNEQIAQLLKCYMRENEFTQRKLANLLGVSEAAISRYLKENRTPNKHVLDRIVTVLKIDTTRFNSQNISDVKQHIERMIKANKSFYTAEEKLNLIRIISS